MRIPKWYEQYEEIRDQANAYKKSFSERCLELGLDEEDFLAAIREDLVARAVHESNRQEGLYLDIPSTQELTKHAFSDFPISDGKDIDMNKVVITHRNEIIKRKRKGASIEELAAYNLSSAFIAIHWLAQNLQNQEVAELYRILLDYINDRNNSKWQHTNAVLARHPELAQELTLLYEESERLKASPELLDYPIAGGIETEGALWKNLLADAASSFVTPSKLRLEHIHFLHRITMMGILPARYSGVFRATSVHVGDPNVLLAPPAFIPQLMEHFVSSFPRMLQLNDNHDTIYNAANTSYSFAIIHPYADGNGRISRLLMNLILWQDYLPTHLKADKKGRKNYSFALRRANRGNIKPLASLIAIHLRDTYKDMIHLMNSAANQFGK
jgi:fido (protein-threonine AMPylation protein)